MKTRLDDFRQRVRAIASEHARWLATAFRDYMALACAGEARHGRGAADRYWLNYPQHGSDRAAAYMAARQYNPAHILEEAVKVFSGHWSNAYGGPKWKRIAEAGTMYGKIPDVAFLDHAVDLSHNGGLYLDKGVVFHMTNVDTYKRMLDRKTSIGLLEPWEESETTSVRVHKDVADLVREGREIGLHTARVIAVPEPVWKDALISWGMEAFHPKLIIRGSEEEHEQLVKEQAEAQKKHAEQMAKMQAQWEAQMAEQAKAKAEYEASLAQAKLVFKGSGATLVFSDVPTQILANTMPMFEDGDDDQEEQDGSEENDYAGLLQNHIPGHGQGKLKFYHELSKDEPEHEHEHDAPQGSVAFVQQVEQPSQNVAL